MAPASRRVMELDDLYVLPEARRRGVGRALIEAVAAHARDAGASRLSVVAYAGNRAAGSIYGAAGFVPHQVRLVRDPSLPLPCPSGYGT